MKKIQSESEILLKTLASVILFPVHIILVIFGKKSFKDIYKPFQEIVHFLFQPRFTMVIILLNIGCFITSMFFKEEVLLSLVLKPSDLLELNIIPFITSGFLHAHIGHLIGNMVALFVFGRVVERKIGPVKTAILYFGSLILSGIFSSLIHIYVLHDNVAGIGASGAVMGFVSAAILLDPFYLTYIFVIPVNVMILGWITITADITGILNPVEDGIGHFAHMGGFLSIAVIMYLFSKKDREALKKGFIINILSLLVAVIIFMIFFRISLK